MKVEIEIYRGWTISFDPDKEIFFVESDENDRSEKKKSFSSAKKYVDDFIKENDTFNPIWVQKIPGSYNMGEKIKLIGLRKDKRFVYEDEKGEKKQMSEHEENNYIVYDHRNDYVYDSIKELQKKKIELDNQIKEVVGKLVRVELSEIKNKY